MALTLKPSPIPFSTLPNLTTWNMLETLTYLLQACVLCHVFSQVGEVHKHQCASLAVSEDGRYLLTAGHNAVKVWDYNMKLDINSQVSVSVCMLFLIFILMHKENSFIPMSSLCHETLVSHR